MIWLIVQQVNTAKADATKVLQEENYDDEKG